MRVRFSTSTGRKHLVLKVCDMSIVREYHDSEGNYWQIETPHYIPPAEAIKNPDYVRGFISADDRKWQEYLKKGIRRNSKVLAFAGIVVMAIVSLFLL